MSDLLLEIGRRRGPRQGDGRGAVLGGEGDHGQSRGGRDGGPLGPGGPDVDDGHERSGHTGDAGRRLEEEEAVAETGLVDEVVELLAHRLRREGEDLRGRAVGLADGLARWSRRTRSSPRAGARRRGSPRHRRR